MTTHFRLASLSAGMMTASDSSSSSCFNTDGAFMVTLLSRTVAPRFLPVTKVHTKLQTPFSRYSIKTLFNQGYWIRNWAKLTHKFFSKNLVSQVKTVTSTSLNTMIKYWQIMAILFFLTLIQKPKMPVRQRQFITISPCHHLILDLAFICCLCG